MTAVNDNLMMECPNPERQYEAAERWRRSDFTFYVGRGLAHAERHDLIKHWEAVEILFAAACSTGKELDGFILWREKGKDTFNYHYSPQIFEGDNPEWVKGIVKGNDKTLDEVRGFVSKKIGAKTGCLYWHETSINEVLDSLVTSEVK